MSLSRRITLAIFLPMAVVLLLNLWMRVGREEALFETDARRDLRALAQALASLSEDVAHSEGEERVRAVLEDASAASALSIGYVSPEEFANDDTMSANDRSRIIEKKKSLTREEQTSEGDDVIVTYQPIRLSENRFAVLTVSETLAQRDAYITTTILRIVLTLALILAMAFLVAFIMGERIVARPIRALLDQLRRVGEGDLKVRNDLVRNDELGAMAREINLTVDKFARAQSALTSETAKKLETIEQLRHAERLATIGQLASGIAHELGTPLHIVSSRAKRIRTDKDASAKLIGEAEIIIGETDRISRIVKQLLAYARREPPKRVVTDMHAVVEQARELLTPLLRKDNCRLRVNAPSGDTTAFVDGDAILQVLTNLVLNGAQAMPDGGDIVIDLLTDDDDTICIRVKDAGQGMTPETARRIFEPFFTTKEVGEGTGLGMSVVQGIVLDHHGDIAIDTRPGGGTTIDVTFPRVDGHAPFAAVESNPRHAMTGPMH